MGYYDDRDYYRAHDYQQELRDRDFWRDSLEGVATTT